MYIYLPIAEIAVNVFLILGLGTGIGVLSGIFGVGGGFLITPLLIFIGIPPTVAVATGANQIVGSSVSGFLAHWRAGTVDFRMGTVLLVGGVIGSTAGVNLFSWLQSLGQIDLVIQISYVVMLGTIGLLMMIESIQSIIRTRRTGKLQRIKAHKHSWVHGLPFKMRFRKSRLYISGLLPFSVGILVGVLSAIMGVGGGFVMIPAMVYLLGMPTGIVVGTSLFQIIFVTANVTLFQATMNQTVDIPLAVLLLIGGVIGAQYGTRIGKKLPGEQLRGLLAALVLAVCGKIMYDLAITPKDLFSYYLP
ncbi:MAG: sulfite exporter TauE/SafE family protein [Rhodospirillales bacterium]|nr:sulfite exporter TauE/SafE family protein [Rhodospirillales bacterium]